MIVRWRDRAAADLERIDEWLASIEGAKPAAVRFRIGEAIEKLERLGDTGRPGTESETRELLVRNAPYVIVYLADGENIDLLAIYHAAQNR